MKIVNKLSRVAVISLIFIAAMSAMAVPNIKANANTVMLVYPDYQKVSVCTIFTVNVDLISYTAGYHGAIFDLFFDPNLVECMGATNTSFPARITSFDVSIDNTIGFIRVNISANSDAIGTGTIAVITFHCKDAGISFFNLTNAALQNVPVDTYPIDPQFLFNGTVEQVPRPVGGEVIALDALALLMPWIAAASAVAVTIGVVLTSRRAVKY